MDKYWYVGGAALIVIVAFVFAILRWGGVRDAAHSIGDDFQDESSSVMEYGSSAMAMIGSDDNNDGVQEPLPSQNISAHSSKSAEKENDGRKSVDVKGTLSITPEVDASAALDDDQKSAPVIDSEAAIIAPSSPAPSTVIPSCSFPSSAPSTTRKIIFNEIAWMGTSSSSNDEWIELKNISASDMDLAGWTVVDDAQKLKVILSEGDTVPANGFFMLSRGSGEGKIYSGDLSNGGDAMALMDPHCEASDYLDASQGWPGGDNSTKQTLERDDDHYGWHTSTLPGGTPAANNSAGPPPKHYALTIDFEGAGGGSVTSDPSGLTCGASCLGNYASGTRLTITPVPGPDMVFENWSGMCYGQVTCSVMMNSDIALSAEFRSTIVIPSDTVFTALQAPERTSQTTTTTSTATAADAVEHILIGEVQIAGEASSNDIVKIHNPTASAVDMSGWKLHKKSQTGTDYSLKVFPEGSVIAPDGVFVWANSEGSFAETVNADVSSTETLSSDNSIALMDADGMIVDQVAWGTGINQYVEGSAYSTDPAPGQMLTRSSSSDGTMMDTDNNVNDFTLK